MGQKDKEAGRMELSRRDFLKVSAAGAAVGAALDFAPAPALANIHTDIISPATTPEGTTTRTSTCPYCSAQCGQKVVVGSTSGKVYDIYGDVNSPTNHGGLCAKGAGAYQLVNNVRRLGVPEHTAIAENGDGKDMTGTAWVRTANDPWVEIPLATAMTEIAAGSAVAGRTHAGLVGIRNAETTSWPASYSLGNNARAVQFFGCSHMNNEANNIYRKIVADFGTSQVEHQARI
jgi:anaerobic selenocysteine-containing dehydrogenase